MAFSRRKRELYISARDSTSLLIVDTHVKRIKEKVEIPEGTGPLALTPDENKLYIANTFQDSITVLNLADRTSSIEFCGLGDKKPVFMKLTPERHELLILDDESHMLISYSTRVKRINSSIRVGKYPHALDLDKTGKIWVTNFGSHNISIVNPTRDLVGEINTERNPGAIVFIP